MSLNAALVKRGYHIMAASLPYDGLLPPTYEGHQLPYWVAAMGGKNWPDEVLKIAGVYQPDAIMVIQDAPYGVAVRNLPLDWSRIAFVMITPVDGTPIDPDWIDTAQKADAFGTISQFGVQAYREAGVQAFLCQPGVDTDVFYRMRDEDRLAMRQAAGIEPGAFVFGMAAQNQGRKCVPETLQAFYEFAKDKPNARLLLDMDAVSPAGWNIPAVCQQWGWDTRKLILREQVVRAGLTNLRERYNLMDVHSVLAHREGFGLPLVESMACGVATMAMDWCSGTEIVGSGKGLLIKPIPYAAIGTWGGAQDKFPDIAHVVSELQRMHDHPQERTTIAERGMQWARAQSWSVAVDNTCESIEKALGKRKAALTLVAPLIQPHVPLVEKNGLSVNGNKPMELVKEPL